MQDGYGRIGQLFSWKFNFRAPTGTHFFHTLKCLQHYQKYGISRLHMYQIRFVATEWNSYRPIQKCAPIVGLAGAGYGTMSGISCENFMRIG
jgi:hypothetical protein